MLRPAKAPNSRAPSSRAASCREPIAAASNSSCSRASRTPTNLPCWNCGRARKRWRTTPNSRRSARRSPKGYAPGPASARPTNPGGRVTPPFPEPKMKVSFFETGRYVPPPGTPREWPVPSSAYDPEIGAGAYRAMVDRARLVEELGFDWISLSEHHYSPRILTPSPPLSAAWIAGQVTKIKIALLGPIVPQSNPIRIAKELAMLDTMAGGRPAGRLFGGAPQQKPSLPLTPKEAGERGDEGMGLILQSWSETQAFRWRGADFPKRTL